MGASGWGLLLSALTAPKQDNSLRHPDLVLQWEQLKETACSAAGGTSPSLPPPRLLKNCTEVFQAPGANSVCPESRVCLSIFGKST